jgi:hypothetical protein
MEKLYSSIFIYIIFSYFEISKLNNIPSWHTGNLKDFGDCVLKIKRFSDDQFYIDLHEEIIHINNPEYLVYTGYDSKNNELTFSIETELDFCFFEICAINFIIKYIDTEDDYRRVNYTYNGRDVYRSFRYEVVLGAQRKCFKSQIILPILHQLEERPSYL